MAVYLAALFCLQVNAACYDKQYINCVLSNIKTFDNVEIKSMLALTPNQKHFQVCSMYSLLNGAL